MLLMVFGGSLGLVFGALGRLLAALLLSKFFFVGTT